MPWYAHCAHIVQLERGGDVSHHHDCVQCKAIPVDVACSLQCPHQRPRCDKLFVSAPAGGHSSQSDCCPGQESSAGRWRLGLQRVYVLLYYHWLCHALSVRTYSSNQCNLGMPVLQRAGAGSVSFHPGCSKLARLPTQIIYFQQWCKLLLLYLCCVLCSLCQRHVTCHMMCTKLGAPFCASLLLVVG